VSAHAPALSSFELPRRVDRAFRALVYIALCMPLGVLGLLALVAVAVTYFTPLRRYNLTETSPEERAVLAAK
jgi:uncharacterized membrane protein YqjE